MHLLKWSQAHAVFVADLDDEHVEIFEAVSQLQLIVSKDGQDADFDAAARRLVAAIVGHFAHEERLMRAARYPSLRWHREQHQSARRKVLQFVLGIEQGDRAAASALAEYLTGWLHNHTRLADRMLGAFLRNRQRGLYKVTLQAGTRPAGACRWVDADGNRFEPPRRSSATPPSRQ